MALGSIIKNRKKLIKQLFCHSLFLNILNLIGKKFRIIKKEKIITQRNKNQVFQE